MTDFGCPVCLEPYLIFDDAKRKREPLMLECGHTLCSNCVQELKHSAGVAKCPIDGQSSSTVVKNYALCDLLDIRTIEQSNHQRALLHSARHSCAQPRLCRFVKRNNGDINIHHCFARPDTTLLCADVLDLILSFADPTFLGSVAPAVSWTWNRAVLRRSRLVSSLSASSVLVPPAADMSEAKQDDKAEDCSSVRDKSLLPVSCTLEWLHSMPSFYVSSDGAVLARMYKRALSTGSPENRVSVTLKKLDGKKQPLLVNLDMNILLVRMYLAYSMGVVPDSIRLIYLGSPLSDDRTFRAQRVTNNALIHLILCMRGS